MWNWPLGAQRKRDLWLLWNASGLVQHSSCQYEPCVFIGNTCQNKTAFEAAAERRWASPETANLFFCLLPKIPCHCCPSCSNGRTDGKHLHSKEIVAIQVCTDRKISYAADSDTISSLIMLFPLRKLERSEWLWHPSIPWWCPDWEFILQYFPGEKLLQQASPDLSWMGRGAFSEDLPVICNILLPMGCENTLKLCKLWVLEPLPASQKIQSKEVRVLVSGVYINKSLGLLVFFSFSWFKIILLGC